MKNGQVIKSSGSAAAENEMALIQTDVNSYALNGIEQVAAHHRYLIDNEQVDGGDDSTFVTAEVVFLLVGGVGNVWR